MHRLGATLAAVTAVIAIMGPAHAGTTNWSTSIFGDDGGVIRSSPHFTATQSPSMSLVITGPNGMCHKTEVRLVRVLANNGRQFFEWQDVDRCHTSFTDTLPWQEMARYSTTPLYDDVARTQPFPGGTYYWQARDADGGGSNSAAMNATLYYQG